MGVCYVSLYGKKHKTTAMAEVYTDYLNSFLWYL